MAYAKKLSFSITPKFHSLIEYGCWSAPTSSTWLDWKTYFSVIYVCFINLFSFWSPFKMCFLHLKNNRSQQPSCQNKQKSYFWNHRNNVSVSGLFIMLSNFFSLCRRWKIGYFQVISRQGSKIAKQWEMQGK